MQCSVGQCNVGQCSVGQCSVAQCNKVQFSIVYFSLVMFSAVHLLPVQPLQRQGLPSVALEGSGILGRGEGFRIEKLTHDLPQKYFKCVRKLGSSKFYIIFHQPINNDFQIISQVLNREGNLKCGVGINQDSFCHCKVRTK